jgi:hypothetical protein
MAAKKPTGGSNKPVKRSVVKAKPRTSAGRSTSSASAGKSNPRASKVSSTTKDAKIKAAKKLVAAGRQTSKQTKTEKRLESATKAGLSMIPAVRGAKVAVGGAKLASKGVKAVKAGQKTKKANASMRAANERAGKFNKQMAEWDAKPPKTPRPARKVPRKDPADLSQYRPTAAEREAMARARADARFSDSIRNAKKPGSTKGYVQRKRGEDF